MSANNERTECWELPNHPWSPLVFPSGFSDSREQFLTWIARIKTQLTGRKAVINLCGDRGLFGLVFCAALAEGAVNLLPQNRQPGTLSALFTRFPDALIVVDQDYDTALLLGAEVLLLQWDTLGDVVAEPEPFTVPKQHIAACVYTSGSTGTPKEIIKPWGTLTATAAMLARRFAVSSWRGPILATVPSQHMYGLEMTLLLGLNSPARIMRQVPFFPADIMQVMANAEQPVNLVTTPYHLKHLLDAQPRGFAIDNIICATAPLDEALAKHAEDVFGARLLEIFGFSEAGSVATRESTRERQWQLLDGFTFDASDSSAIEASHLDGVARIDDRIVRQGERCFSLLGRSADMLNVGGKRSSIPEITARMKNIDGVHDAAVFIPSGKERPAALVVAAIDVRRIATALLNTLDPVFIPRPIKRVDNIPRNDTGKLLKNELQALL